MVIPGRMNKVVDEIERYGIDLAALQEVRWRGSGEIKRRHFTLLYSGEEKQVRNRVAFVIAQNMKERIIKFDPKGGRLAYLRIRGEKENLSVINVYAPTEDANEEEKEDLYDKIKEMYERIPKADAIIMMGDFNARVGKEEYLRDIAASIRYMKPQTIMEKGCAVWQQCAT